MASLACHFCGYDLAGVPLVDGARRCPECGKQGWPPPEDVANGRRAIWLAPVIVGACAMIAIFVGDDQTGKTNFDTWERVLTDIVGIPAASIANGIVAGIALRAAQARGPRSERGMNGKLKVVAYGVLVAAITFLAGIFVVTTLCDHTKPNNGGLFGY